MTARKTSSQRTAASARPQPPPPVSSDFVATPAGVSQFAQRNDDFGFEMRVAEEIRSTLGVSVAHGGTYVDRFSGKPRQFDLRFAVKQERRALYFAVECKNVDPERPIIVCGRQSEQAENYHDVIVVQGGSPDMSHVTTRPAKGCLYQRGQFVGKTILKPEKGRSNDSEIYDRWSQALNSAHDLVVEAASAAPGFDMCCFGAVFPWLVVPDRCLWTVEYQSNGQMNPAVPADWCRYYVAHHHQVLPFGPRVCLTHIEIITFTGLQRRLGELHGIAHDWEDWIPSSIRDSYRNGG